jgi:crotonobetainyl-CoA:carnitine CoA-transferase CaiB-like acyl-CoA transferase
MKVGVGIADVVCGLYAATAILAALRHRDQTGQGQHIDLALADAQVSWLVNAGTNYLISRNPQPRLGNQHPNIVPYQVFGTKDGHVIVAVGNDTQYTRFCEIVGRPDLATDIRFAKNVDRVAFRDILIPILAKEIAQHPKDWLVSEMETAKIPGGPINTLPEVFASDQVAARDMVVSVEDSHAFSGYVDLIGNPIKLSKTPITYRQAPPMCGAHTQEILTELFGSDFKIKGT